MQADRVFRLYVKIIEGKTYCRGEELLVLNQLLPQALDTIRHPYKSIEEKMDTLIECAKKGDPRFTTKISTRCEIVNEILSILSTMISASGIC